MATLMEMASEIVMAHVGKNPMSKDELLKEMQEVYSALAALEKGESVGVEATSVVEEVITPAEVKRSIAKNSITCLICGVGMKTLTRHLKTKHDMKPGEYRKQFGIPRTQALAAKAYSETRKQMAIDRGLGENLAKARAAKAAASKGKAKAKSTKAQKVAAPAAE